MGVEGPLAALEMLFEPISLMLLCGGTAFGIILGALPGLSATMGLALAMPFAYYLSVEKAMPLLLGVYLGAVIGASIPAILIGIPGNPNAIATVYDGFAMAKKGLAGKALGGATVASFLGGMISLAFLVLLSPQVARFALFFGPPEYFALAVFGLTIIAAVSGKELLKGLAVAVLGFALSLVGLDSMTGVPRFTFGSIYLMDGISLVPALIGLYAFAQVFSDVESLDVFKQIHLLGLKGIKFREILLSPREIASNLRTVLESALIGTGIGAFPGTGASIAVFLAYFRAKRKRPDLGSGVLTGVMAPESANNAVTGGALIPTLALGIPGDSSTAVMLSALIVMGVQPGPLLFRDHIEVVHMIFISLLLANMAMMIFQLIGIRFFVKALAIPPQLLMPLVVVFSTLGCFALQERISDVLIALAFGLGGYVMEKGGFPKAPLLLGLILGPIAEPQFRRSMVLFQGDWTQFFSRPISLALFALTAVALLSPVLRRKGR